MFAQDDFTASENYFLRSKLKFHRVYKKIPNFQKCELLEESRIESSRCICSLFHVRDFLSGCLDNFYNKIRYQDNFKANCTTLFKKCQDMWQSFILHACQNWHSRMLWRAAQHSNLSLARILTVEAVKRNVMFSLHRNSGFNNLSID